MTTPKLRRFKNDRNRIPESAARVRGAEALLRAGGYFWNSDRRVWMLREPKKEREASVERALQTMIQRYRNLRAH